ncbi:MAG: rod-binding protein [Planctomycetes bacterium]|nr:rod-binding protein [Planctomycetota bacterium]
MSSPLDVGALTGLRPPSPDPAVAARHRDAAVAAEKFEGLMLTNLLKSAFGESSESMFGSGPGAHIYRGFMETYLADHLARAGGLGLQDTLTRALGGELEALGPSAPSRPPASDLGGEA